MVAESLYDDAGVYAASEDRKPVAAALVGKVGYRFVDKLRASSKVDVNEGNLNKVRIDTSMAGDDGHGKDLTPPAMGGGTAPPPPPLAPAPDNPLPSP